ncbi:MAG: DUF4287 domain-containing protein [Actinomycetes bacterium]
MADPADGIAAQIRGIEQRHGKPIAVWIELMKAGSLSKPPDVVAMLKNDHRIPTARRTASRCWPATPASPGRIRSRQLWMRSTPASGRPCGRSTTYSSPRS